MTQNQLFIRPAVVHSLDIETLDKILSPLPWFKADPTRFDPSDEKACKQAIIDSLSQMDFQLNESLPNEVQALLQIQDLMSDDGYDAMLEACRTCNALTLVENMDASSIAAYIVMDRPDILDVTKRILSITKPTTWKFYNPDQKLELMKLDAERMEIFQRNLLQIARYYKYGEQFNVHPVLRGKKLILDIYYPSYLKRKLRLSESGEMSTSPDRDVMDATLIFSPDTGLFQIRTSARQPKIKEQIKEAFARAFLINPEPLLDSDGEVIHLSELKQWPSSGPPPKGFPDIHQVNITRVSFIDAEKSQHRVDHRCSGEDFWEWCRSCNMDTQHIEIFDADIQFVFGQNIGRNMTVTLNGNTNSIRYKDTESKGDIAIRCLKAMGIVDV